MREIKSYEVKICDCCGHKSDAQYNMLNQHYTELNGKDLCHNCTPEIQKYLLSIVTAKQLEKAIENIQGKK